VSRQQTRVLQKIFLNISIPLASLCITVILLYVFLPAKQNTPITPPGVATAAPPIVHETTTPIAAISAPVQLKIENIAVDAYVNPVGVNAAGDMDIEDIPEQLAWYKFGPKPGEEGSAVIAGHYGWKDGVPSVFNDLNKLIAGDTLSTYGADGQVKTFVVTRTATYAPDQDATDIFRSDDGKAHLNLVTCQGSWNNSLRTYSERFIVFTDLLD